MSTLDQIVYQGGRGASQAVRQVASSMPDQALSEHWWQQLDPWLRTGSPLGRSYLNFGAQAALLRWCPDPAAQYGWEYAHVLIGPRSVMTSSYALELPELSAEQPLPGAGRLLRVTRTALGHDYGALRSRVRSQEVTGLLVPLLARVLAGEQNVTMPWTGPWLPEAAMWGLTGILSILEDARPVSFLTYAAGPMGSIPGLFVSFRPGAGVLPPDPGYETVAADLAMRFSTDPAQLRRTIRRRGMTAPAGQPSRIAQLLDLVPAVQPVTAHSRKTPTLNTNVPSPPAAAPPPAPAPAAARAQTVPCPVCLHDINDWDALPYWRWDAHAERYVESPLPPDLNPSQQARHRRGAYVRCTAPQTGSQSDHYLPVNYGLFGPPVVLGFIGLTKSGKSHLLASMLGAMENGGLHEYGISWRPVDQVMHQRFLDDWVNPLFRQGKVLPGTQEGIVTFADAFLMRRDDSPERPVALFDVAGGDLARPDDTKQFLEIANGLLFVVDADHLDAHQVGDETFSNVLNVVADSNRSDQVSAAIVLNKADKVRFEEPVARWLRADAGALDPDEFLLESADVYAYLQWKQAAALTISYRQCGKATLHIASPTGGTSDGLGEGGVYPRGVKPKRVLRPLVAMLAMTGILAGPDAERVGI